MKKECINRWQTDLSISSGNGLDFIFAGVVVWGLSTCIWSLDFTPYTKAVLVLFATGLLFPLAWLFSMLLKTNWKNSSNPLRPLALWFNVAQLFYMPMLALVLLRLPECFITAFAIITGGHFFPCAWLYRTKWYAIFAAVTPAGALLITITAADDHLYAIPLFVCMSLVLL